MLLPVLNSKFLWLDPWAISLLADRRNWLTVHYWMSLILPLICLKLPVFVSTLSFDFRFAHLGQVFLFYVHCVFCEKIFFVSFRLFLPFCQFLFDSRVCFLYQSLSCVMSWGSYSFLILLFQLVLSEKNQSGLQPQILEFWKGNFVSIDSSDPMFILMDALLDGLLSSRGGKPWSRFALLFNTESFLLL